MRSMISKNQIKILECFHPNISLSGPDLRIQSGLDIYKFRQEIRKLIILGYITSGECKYKITPKGITELVMKCMHNELNARKPGGLFK